MKLNKKGFSWPGWYLGNLARATTVRAVMLLHAGQAHEEQEVLAEAIISPKQWYAIKARKKGVRLCGATVEYDFELSKLN